MGLFNFGKKNPQEKEVQEQKAPGNPTTMILFRVLAIGYVLWMLKDVVKAYFAGGPDAPNGWFVLISCVVLGAGCVWIAIVSFKQWKQMKEAERIYNEEVARQYAEEERLEAERKALEEEFPDDGEYYEEETEETEEVEEETEEAAE